jgi:hypothetical protein
MLGGGTGKGYEVVPLTGDELLTYQTPGSDPAEYPALAEKFIFVKNDASLPSETFFVDADGAVVLLSESSDPSDVNLLTEILYKLELANSHLDAAITRVG